MQRFNNKESKRREAHIQYQCCMVAFFDALGFVCTKVLGNIRRNRIPDGHENQGKNILHPHCCRISCQCLRAEGIYHRLYNHHTDRYGRLLENRWNSNLKHGTQLPPVKPGKGTLIPPHPIKKNQKGKHSRNALCDQSCKGGTEHAESQTGYHPKIHPYIQDGGKDQQPQRNF